MPLGHFFLEHKAIHYCRLRPENSPGVQSAPGAHLHAIIFFGGFGVRLFFPLSFSFIITTSIFIKIKLMKMESFWHLEE